MNVHRRRRLPPGHVSYTGFNAGLGASARRKVVDLAAVQPIADTNLNFIESVENIELGQRQAVDAADATLWRTKTASNQPQRRGRR